MHINNDILRVQLPSSSRTRWIISLFLPDEVKSVAIPNQKSIKHSKNASGPVSQEDWLMETFEQSRNVTPISKHTQRCFHLMNPS
jgi:hypothetical protein